MKLQEIKEAIEDGQPVTASEALKYKKSLNTIFSHFDALIFVPMDSYGYNGIIGSTDVGEAVSAFYEDETEEDREEYTSYAMAQCRNFNHL